MNTDEKFRSSLQNITNKSGLVRPNLKKDLKAPGIYASIPANQGRGTDGTTSQGGGSISSPLTEQTRTYHADKLATSSDGLFSFHYANVYELNCKDANDADVKLVLANP